MFSSADKEERPIRLITSKRVQSQRRKIRQHCRTCEWLRLIRVDSDLSRVDGGSYERACGGSVLCFRFVLFSGEEQIRSASLIPFRLECSCQGSAVLSRNARSQSKIIVCSMYGRSMIRTAHEILIWRRTRATCLVECTVTILRTQLSMDAGMIWGLSSFFSSGGIQEAMGWILSQLHYSDTAPICH